MSCVIPKTLACVISASILCACLHTKAPEANKAAFKRSDSKKSFTARNTDINQIQSSPTSLHAPQIQTYKSQNKLTIDQLKNYADRCLPNAKLPSKQIDCTDLKLRMTHVFKNDDKVIEALTTLNRLGTTNLNNNSTFNTHAIASGTLNDQGVSTPTVTNEFYDFLKRNGLTIDAGTIIIGTNGG